MNSKELELFKEKRKLWIDCFSKQDKNSIIFQIYHLIKNAAIYNLINESIKLAPVNRKGEKEMNGLIYNFIDDCFINSQFIAIRRLTDSYPLDHPEKGVNSLNSLLNDMKIHSYLFTRENILNSENLEYNYEEIQQKRNDFLLKQIKERNSNKWFNLPDGLDASEIKRRHEEIDILANVDSQNRTTNDKVSNRIFDMLLNKVNIVTKDINELTNKFIAHNATKESRDSVNADETKITYGEIWSAHKALCQTACFIDRYLLTGGSHLLFDPFGGVFEYIDKPLVTLENVSVLKEKWKALEKEYNSWAEYDIENFKKETAIGNI